MSSTERRKRDRDDEPSFPSSSKKHHIIGPASKPATISAAPVTYTTPPGTYAEPPSTYHAPSTPLVPTFPVYPDPSLYVAMAAMNRPSTVKSVPASSVKVDDKKKQYHRQAAGQNWVDPTLSEWSEDDFRIFCGDLGNEVHDEMLRSAFSKYPTLLRARVVRDKKTGKSKGYGFVSFSDAHDFASALRDMNGKYVGNRPVKLKKSRWKDRNEEDLPQQAPSGHKRK